LALASSSSSSSLATVLHVVFATAFAPSGFAGAASVAPADTIFVGEHILTFDPAQPAATGVAVRGGLIVAVGTRESLQPLTGPGTRRVELGARALLPGFIDAHGHLTALAATSALVDLRPAPSGRVDSMPALQQSLRAALQSSPPSQGRWLVGIGYDDSQIAGNRHPTRDDLDAVSASMPILVVHASGHIGAANGALLRQLGISAATDDPAGGVIRRRPGSREPDGVLEESVLMQAYGRIPPPGPDESLAQLVSALRVYARYGITTVQDGAASPDNLALLERAAARRLLDLDVVAYRFWAPLAARLPDDRPFGFYERRLKVGGVKLILDGSPQAKTAWLTQPYRVPPAGRGADYRGYPAMPQPLVERAVREALSRRVPLLAHANGDAAAQSLIDAVRLANPAGAAADLRPVMVHAQTVRDDQLDAMAVLGLVPSFFVAHTYFWGDWHRDETLGLARAERISPLRSAQERALPFTLHNDAPIVAPDMIATLWSATTRRTRSNDILGPAQRITVREALEAVTINAARQYFEETRKGSLTVGKQADLVLLSADPLGIDPERLREIEVDETISRGVTVWPVAMPAAPTRNPVQP